MPRGENLERDRPPREVLAARFGVEPLAPGERSEKVRIRGPGWLFEALEKLSPRERGRVVVAGLEALGLLEEGREP